MKLFYTFCFFFAGLALSAQDGRKILKGKITSDAIELDGINIVNLGSQFAAVSQSGGYFSIPAAKGDTLMFSAVQFKGKLVAVSEKNFDDDLMFVRLESLVTQLEEVKIVRYNNINAVALGIIPKSQKSYTPAERKLKAATDLSGSAGGVLSVDPLLNWLSGRTAMLKKEVEVEKKERLLKRISEMFEEEYFIKQLKIPSEYLQGFWYYLVEDQKLINAINSKNKTMAAFLIAELADKYNSIIAPDSK